MTEISQIPIVGDVVRIRRPAIEQTLNQYITLLIIDSMNGTFDEKLNFYQGIKFPFDLPYTTPYNFFPDDVVKNFGKITTKELIEKYPEYII